MKDLRLRFEIAKTHLEMWLEDRFVSLWDWFYGHHFGPLTPVLAGCLRGAEWLLIGCPDPADAEA